MARIFDEYMRWLLAGFLILLLIVAYAWSQQENTPEPNQTITLATGSETGMYNRFGEALVELDPSIVLRQTAGSSENLELLQAGEVDFALVQNDLAQYASLGIRERARFDELNYVLPVFPEFVQVIVTAESELRVFGDLRGQQICIGAPGSGTYYNAIDVLEEAGLREGIDFFPVLRPSLDCLDSLEAGELAAVFFTSNRQIEMEDERFRQLDFSASQFSVLSSSFQYFRVITQEDNLNLDGPQLAVDAYLATRSDVPQAKVAQLTQEIIAEWPALQSRLPQLPDIYVPSVRETIPYHPGSNGELEDAGLKQFDWFAPLIIVGGLAIVAICVLVESWKYSYNRLGENPNNSGWRKYVLRWIGVVSRYVIAFSFLALLIISSVFVLRWIEDDYALSQGTVSPFAQLDIYDSFVWLFTYIGNGFTADDIYPVSFAGKVVVGVLAVMGFAVPVGIIFLLVSISVRASERTQEGLGRPNFSNHVIICGWNEKARGIIATLTGTNVPAKRKVVLVAQPTERFPLEKFGFNLRLVGFCRGSPTDPDVLERSGIAEAAAVIVLADFSGHQSMNKGSILSAMNARRANPQAHLCTELGYVENIDLLEAAGCQTQIYVTLIAGRLAALSAMSSDLIDFVLDCVTYHDSKHDELYAIPVRDLAKSRNIDGISVADLRLKLARTAVNVVGVIDETYRDATIDAAFQGGEDQTLVDYAYRNRPLSADATVVYAAQKADRIKGRRDRIEFDPVTSVPHFQLDHPSKLSVLVCAGKRTLAAVENELRCVYGDGLNFVAIDLDEGRSRSVTELEELVPDDLDKCIIMNTADQRNELDSIEAVNEADTEIMLLTTLFAKIREKRGHSWQIVGEIGMRENAELLRSAGANEVLPVSMVVERFLAKEVYDRNHVTEFLLAAMRLSDGVYLHRHVVREGDGFCGQGYANLLATQIDGMRIMGWRPKNAEESLRNDDGDFGFHYRMVIDSRIEHSKAGEGDILILMMRRREAYQNMNFVAANDGEVENAEAEAAE